MPHPAVRRLRACSILAAAMLVALAGGPRARGASGEAGPPPIAVGEGGFRLELEDQYGEPVTYPLSDRGVNEQPVVLVVAADRKGSAEAGAWREVLRGRYGAEIRREEPRLVVLRLAHLAGVPALLRGPLVKRFFKGEGSTALDYPGHFAEQLGFVPRSANLALLDRAGVLRLRLDGPPTEARREALFRAVDALLEPPSPGRNDQPEEPPTEPPPEPAPS